MQENTSVQQLAEALEQLLNAYDKLKYENKQTLEHNKDLELQIQELESRNSDLEVQVEELSDTTNHNSNEIGNMLGRIKSILVETPKNETPTEVTRDDNREPLSNELEKEETSELPEEIYPEQSTFDENLMEHNQSNTEKQEEQEELTQKEDNKDFDLGRMQSLLNGFNK